MLNKKSEIVSACNHLAMLNKKSEIVSACNDRKKTPNKQSKEWKECMHCLTPTRPRLRP